MANFSGIIKNVLNQEILDQEIGAFVGSPDPEAISLFRQTNVMKLRGWALFALYPGFQLDPNLEMAMVENISTEDQTKIKAAYDFVNVNFPLVGTKSKKQKARERIYKDLGDYDVYDMLADVSKRLGMLERLTVRMAKKLKDDGILTGYVETAYGPLVDQYVALIDAGVAKDRVDLEDLPQLFAKIQTRMTTIAHIVEEEMFTEE